MSTRTASRVFTAVSDPTRRALLDQLRDGERSAGTLAEAFEISQPAVSQHLRVLREAGLVTVRPQGRERFYRLRPGPLREVVDWLAHYQAFWEEHLHRLEEFMGRDDG